MYRGVFLFCDIFDSKANLIHYMKTKIFQFLCLTSIFFLVENTFAQDYNEKDFKVLITSVSGDLNKDGINDEVTVIQDTLNDKRPYCINIYFKTPEGARRKVVSSFRLIRPQFPEGKDGFRDGSGFNSIEIKKGILIVFNDLLRGHSEYKFRYQNNNFELIGYTYVSSNGIGSVFTEDFNLSTGVRNTKEESYETDKIISSKTKKILIRPLPKLQDIAPFENDWQ